MIFSAARDQVFLTKKEQPQQRKFLLIKQPRKNKKEIDYLPWRFHARKLGRTFNVGLLERNPRDFLAAEVSPRWARFLFPGTASQAYTGSFFISGRVGSTMMTS